MVDAVQSFEAKAPMTMPVARREPAVVANAVAAKASSTLEAYASLCEAGVSAPSQSAAWVRAWVAETAPDAVFATLSVDGRQVFALALEVLRVGPFRVARFMSGRHANGNFAASLPAWLPLASPANMAALMGAIRAARPDIDLVALERLLPDLDGRPNPLLSLPHFDSPNISLAVDLAGGFDELLKRSSGKRKRKKHRSQTRKFEAAGGFRRIEAGTPAETARLLDAFFSMKEIRFRKAGIADVFGEPEIRAFFRRLFGEALAQAPSPFVLHGIEVGGKLRAITGSSRCGNRLVCEFGAILEDELAGASPGDFLFFDNIRDACEQGYGIYDFSVGDELYKRLWCDLETRHVDVVVPLSVKGRGLAVAMRLYARLKAFIKTSPMIWKLTKTLRKRTAGQPAEAAED